MAGRKKSANSRKNGSGKKQEPEARISAARRKELQQALDVSAKYTNYSEASRQSGIPRTTLQTRVEAASRLGMTPKKGMLPSVSLAGEQKRGTRLTEEQMLAAVDAYNEAAGNKSHAAEAMGLSREAFSQRLKHAIRFFEIDTSKPLKGGSVSVQEPERVVLPSKGKVRRFILTSGQNNTHVHDRLWDNLHALANDMGDTDLFVGTFSYNHNAYGPLAVKRGKAKKQTGPWYDGRLTDYMVDRPIEIAPGLVWSGHFNCLPTAVWPLSDLHRFNGRKSNVFPHASFAMDSVESAKHEATKFNYTTGTVTAHNYIQKKAGIKAEQRHGYGAVLVEIDSDGRWFVRQLEADQAGTIYDIDRKVEGGKVKKGYWCKSVTWGDIHEISLRNWVRELCWGKGGMLDILHPEHQFFEDLLDFRSRNHHDFRDPYLMYEKWVEGIGTVEGELSRAADFLRYASRPWCQQNVVRSNHDIALDRWTKEQDWRRDPENAHILLKLQLAMVEAIKENRQADFHMLQHALAAVGYVKPENVRFFHEDESFVLCREHHDGVEMTEHGHNGAGGKPGTPTGFAKSGRRMTIGDKHKAGWYHGVCVAGVSGDLDQRYNKGPSAWSHSHVVMYENSARQIVTLWDGKWRA